MEKTPNNAREFFSKEFKNETPDLTMTDKELTLNWIDVTEELPPDNLPILVIESIYISAFS